MGTIRKTTWPLGYTPGANDLNGDDNGLVVAQNLTFDEQGIVRLSKGTAILSSGPFPAAGEALSSTVFDLNTLINSSFPGRAKVRYVGLANGQLLRNYGPTFKTITDYEIAIFNSSNGSNGIYALGNAFGHTLAFSGSAKFKDRGDLQHPLGMPADNFGPTVTANVPPICRADDPDGTNKYTRWDATAVEGTGYTNVNDYIPVTTVALENFSRAIIQRAIATTANLDLNAMLPSGRGTSEDFFSFNLRLQFSDYFIKVRVEYILSAGTAVQNYYWHEWTNRISAETSQTTGAFDFIPADMSQDEINALAAANTGVTFVSSIREGRDTWTPLTCKRSEFNRVGNDDSLSWSSVKGIRITYYTTQNMEVLFNEARFIGGDFGQLTGEFTYIQQDIRDTNSYVEMGIPSAESQTITAYGTSINVSPRFPNSQANGLLIYRLSNATDGFYVIKRRLKQRIVSWTNANPSTITAPGHGLSTGSLIKVTDGYGAWHFADNIYTVTVANINQFQVIADTTTYGPMTGDLSFVDLSPFNDFMSDAEALYGGAVNRLDRNKALLPDDIIGMVAPYFSRVIYLTTKVIIPSEQNDPSRYDLRYQIENAADTGEINLFIAQLAERVMVIGTTKGFYSLIGDGTVTNSIIDFKLDTLGIEQPPVSSAYVVNNSILYYLAADGWRFINGAESGLLTAPLRLQFPPWNETRYGYPPYKILPANGVKISAVTMGGKAYFAMDQNAHGRTVLIYDFITSRWEYRRNAAAAANNPYVMFVEEDGTILFTTEESGDKNLHQLEVGNSYNGDMLPQQVKLATVFDDDQKPNNRKDALTLFLDIDSGAANLTINLAGVTTSNVISSATFSNAFSGRQRKAFDCSQLQPQNRFRLDITGDVHTFKIYEYSLEYQDRPLQLNFLRIPPNNWNIAGRKRIPEIPMLIDTLGNTIDFTPIIDNTVLPSSSFVKTDKDVYHHVFNEERAGYVIGGTLKASGNGVFEFYDLIIPREVELLPDPLSYKHIPYTNLGNGSRKRFIQFAFVIDTRGFDVAFTPSIDGTAFPPFTYNTTRRRTVVYTFVTEAIGIDIGGILDSVTSNQKFEYFGIDLSECISEKLPPVARYVKVPCTNFGTASRKRVRTIPLVIDTRGGTVTFTPSVDGTAFPPSTHVTTDKRTVLHYFETDAIGIDYCGLLTSPTEFEFYGIGQQGPGEKPETVEVLPVAKKYDQVGPVELKRLGRIYMARVRVINTGTALSYDLILDGVSSAAGTWLTVAEREQVLEIKFPKFIMATIAKLELKSTTPFHRLYAELLVRLTGNDTDNTWVKLQ